jgi:hypothetical protein
MDPALNDLYRQRLGRYTAAMRNEQPDCVPIRPFVAEFTTVFAGYTCQQTAHDYTLGFDAALRTAQAHDWDAVVPNMIATWTGMTQALGLKYYMTPGIDVPAHVGHQYLEPSEEQAFMRSDEYDALIADPTGFLLEVWLPRVSSTLCPIGTPVTPGHNLTLVKGGMAMMEFFAAWARQEQRLKSEAGMPSAIAGILKAPLDILADKLRGYVGLTLDIFERPEKVQAACEALAPHLFHVALTTSDPTGHVPIGFWMHRGCVPFVSPETFSRLFWPTLKPIVEELWRHGRQTLFYAEGNWDHHLTAFAELPERSIVYHIDKGNLALARKTLGDRFCLSGGLSNHLLSFGKPQDVREACKKIIQEVAQDGGYIMDAGAIMQNDTQIENVRAMTEATREYGVFSRGHAPDPAPVGVATAQDIQWMGRSSRNRPGVCQSWNDKKSQLPPILGDEQLAQRIWEQVDSLGNAFIWQILLSF